MRLILFALLALGMASAATLMTFDVDIENACDETTEITVVTVTDSVDGDPMENVYVKVEDIDPWKQKTTGLTNDEGIYDFEGCGDTWNVSTSYGGYETRTITTTLGACGSCKAAPTPPPTQNTTQPQAPSEPTPTSNNSAPPPSTTSAPSNPPPETTSAPSTPPRPDEPQAEDETPEETSGKKPLPCCASSAILLGIVGLAASRSLR